MALGDRLDRARRFRQSGFHPIEKLLAPDRRDPAAPAAFRANPLACGQAAFDPARRPTDGVFKRSRPRQDRSPGKLT